MTESKSGAKWSRKIVLSLDLESEVRQNELDGAVLDLNLSAGASHNLDLGARHFS
jgi:hypothetical protein